MPDKPFREVVSDLKASAHELRGSVKLRAALDAFEVDVDGRICLDVGASTGGFTTVLLERGARRVYAVDVGHGQLLGSLRQDQRVVNLEATNIAELSVELVPDPVDLVTIDVSYLALADAAVQLNRLAFAPGTELVALVKPMFELRLAEAPTDDASLRAATEKAAQGITAAGWDVSGTFTSSQRGAKGAIEGWAHAVRTTA